ncbi:MAG: SPFH domain-containing protein [Desulfococcaceae bacterium]|jgi:regulator of protease activity HflC (stomatin/prohibitin superfamily)|nr:SPFH domain-containing protein [Desulfococcaceae bacterium]
MTEKQMISDEVKKRAVKSIGSFLCTKPVIFIIIIFLSGYVFLSSIMVSIDPGHVGVVFSKFGKTPEVEGRFIVEKGEKGYWREVLLPGRHFFWLGESLWKYDITEEPMISIDSQHIGLVEALDGTVMPPGEILATEDITDEKGVFHMGGKGPRREVLKPGLHPVNPKYLRVTKYPAVVIPEGKIGVVIRKTGDQPPDNMVLVPRDSSYRGIQQEIIPPGTNYFNPLALKVEQVPATVIEKGQVGIVTKKVGKVPPPGTILVSRDDEFQGIQREVMQPGMYYINPYDREVKVVPAVIVPDGFVGVQIAKTGKSKTAGQLLAKPGERGILEETLPPGMYYINPYEYEIIAFDTREQRYEMTQEKDEGDTSGDDAIHFLSDDGFMIQFDLTLLYQVKAEDAPMIVATVGRDISTVRDKKIRPPARAFARIIGSKNRGEEFIHGTTREKFQADLHTAVKEKCEESKIIINQTLVRHFEVPVELRTPITQRVIALKLEDQYKQEQNTQKANAELSRQKQLVVFESEKVKAETIKIQAVIAAEQQRDEAEILMAKKKFEAEGDAAKKKIDAEAVLYAARKEAEGIEARLMAEAKGQKAMVDAWSGSGAQYIVASKLAEVMQGAQLLPLETLFGGGGGSGEGNGPIRYHNTMDLLNFFNINKLTEKNENRE